MAEDIGESLVGSYFRYVVGCEFVLFNTFLTDGQGEIDVIGIRLGSPREVYFAEVATHVDGMLYGDGNASTIKKIREKLLRAQRFAQEKFPDDAHHLQIWSPKVARGAMTVEFESMAREFEGRAEHLDFMINERYGDAVQELIMVARGDSRATNDPAFRLLQVLTRVRATDGHPLC